MNQEPELNGAFESYRRAMHLRMAHRLLFMLASVSVSIWFLTPTLLEGLLPIHVKYVTSGVILAWLASLIPKHLSATRDVSFRGLGVVPFLQFRLLYAALRPSKDEIASHQWTGVLTVLSAALPIVSFLISVLLLLLGYSRIL